MKAPFWKLKMAHWISTGNPKRCLSPHCWGGCWEARDRFPGKKICCCKHTLSLWLLHNIDLVLPGLKELCVKDTRALALITDHRLHNRLTFNTAPGKKTTNKNPWTCVHFVFLYVHVVVFVKDQMVGKYFFLFEWNLNKIWKCNAFLSCFTMILQDKNQDCYFEVHLLVI